MRQLFLFLCVTLMCCSCAAVKDVLAGNCFEIGGGYKGATGTIKYCFDSNESTKVGLPIVSSPEAGKGVILNEVQVQQIVDGLAVTPDAKKHARAATRGYILSPFERLKGFLGGKK